MSRQRHPWSERPKKPGMEQRANLRNRLGTQTKTGEPCFSPKTPPNCDGTKQILVKGAWAESGGCGGHIHCYTLYTSVAKRAAPKWVLFLVSLQHNPRKGHPTNRIHARGCSIPLKWHTLTSNHACKCPSSSHAAWPSKLGASDLKGPISNELKRAYHRDQPDVQYSKGSNFGSKDQMDFRQAAKVARMTRRAKPPPALETRSIEDGKRRILSRKL